MTLETPQHAELAEEMAALPRGSHVCLVYDGPPDDQWPALLPFLREGLSAGERCIYVADDSTITQLETALLASGVDVPAARASGALWCWTRDEWREPGELDPDAKAARVREIIDQSALDGFSGIRFGIEMTWATDPDVDHDQLLRWEAMLNGVVQRRVPVRMICQYSRQRLAPEVLRAGLATHPTAVVGAEVGPNAFYEAPLLLEDGTAPDSAVGARRVEWMVERLRWSRAFERERTKRRQTEAALAEAERSRLRIAELLGDAQAAREAAEEHLGLLETINRLNRAVTTELDLERVVQSITDAATEATGAAFGAFFYNVVDEAGESYTLYTLSGVDRSHFERFPLPRNTDLFGPTFRGEATVRLDDVREDARFGRNPPYFGMPAGHLPVRSYLAVPVVAAGEVLGGLFFGHAQPGVFSERDERVVEGIAPQAAIAIQRARLYEEARRAVRIRDEFLGVASHELKTPLTVVKGYSQWLARKLEDGVTPPEQLRAFTRHLVTHSGRLGQLVDDLLDTSRIHLDRLDLYPEPVDLAALTAAVVARFAEDPLRTSRHSLQLEAPAAVEGVWDAGRMDQVVTNLVSNALKYSPDGGEVRVSVRVRGGDAVLTVRDHGLGIPREEQSELFQPFHRGHAHARVIPGSGLGLYISSHIVERHGGSMTVASVLGQGSTFTVRLPLDARSDGSA